MREIEGLREMVVRCRRSSIQRRSSRWFYSSRGGRQRRHDGDDWPGCTTCSVLLLGANLGDFGCGGRERGYGHLRLGPWRPHALILDEEVASEVAHASAVSSMRRRKKTRPLLRIGMMGRCLGCGLGRVGLCCWADCWAAAAGKPLSIFSLFFSSYFLF
jgi:hypothetical protein